MAKKKASNEEIIAALLQHGTITEAAAAAGISPRTIYTRFRDDRIFRSEYIEAKAGIVRQAAISINGKLSAAIETVAEIMEDKSANPATRLQAAQTIIGNAAKFAERLATDEKRSWTEAQDPLWID